MAPVHIKYMHFVFHEKSRANENVKGSECFDDLIPTSLLLITNLDICKIVIVCPGQHHVKAQVWSFENVREKQK